MREPPSDELLARYLASEATREESLAVETWAASAPEHSRALADLRAAWDSRGPVTEGTSTDRAWRRLNDALDETPVIQMPARAPISTARWLKIAAAAVVVIGGAALLSQVLNPGLKRDLLLSTGPAQHQSLDLDDGSRVVLGPMSHLRVVEGYGDAVREVVLNGEAWFDVIHNEAIPFRVISGGTITEDLGTSFSVRTLPDSSGVRVVVVTGSVSVRQQGAPPNDGVRLIPNQAATIERGGAAMVSNGVDAAKLTAWQHSRLYFDNAGAHEVLVDLHRWYGLEFRVADSTMLSRVVSATLPTDNLTEALDIVSALLGVKATRTADTVTFR